MSFVTIQDFTVAKPISMIGAEAGICWGADTTNEEKNYKRGLDCLRSGHMRTAEYPQVYMVLDGYSARVIREFYTHIAGGPTRLQASTRYIDYEHGFRYIVPTKIQKNPTATMIYLNTMDQITEALKELDALEIPKEDSANLLPLGMETKVVVRTNLRNLIDMSHQRLCTRAYWEFRILMDDIMKALSEYSDQWKYIVQNYFKPKCEVCGFCTEKYSCGRRPKKDDPDQRALNELFVNLKMSWKDFLNEIKSDKVRKFLEDLVDKD